MPQKVTDEEKWKKRLQRKGPFYLYSTSPRPTQKYIDGVWVDVHEGRQTYYVIWNDGHKTKFGSFSDGMSCRYGVATACVLNGDTKFDLWNGHTINDDIFERMLEVREGTSNLPHFNLDIITDLTW